MVNRIRIAFGVPLLLLAVVGAISYHTAAELAKTSAYLAHSHDVLAAGRQLNSDIADLAVVQQKFFLAGEKSNPQADRLTANIISTTRQLRESISENASQGRAVDELASTMQLWQSVMAEAVATRDRDGMKVALEIFKKPEVLKISNRVRTALTELNKEESELLLRLHERAKDNSLRAKAVIGLGTIAALLVGLLAASAISRRLMRSMHELIRAAKRFGEGSLEHRLPETSDELGLLGRAFNTMAANLHSVQQAVDNKSAALIEERNLLRTLIDHLPEYVFIKDADRRFIVENKALMNSQGISDPAHVLGMMDEDFYRPLEVERFRVTDEAVIQSGQPLLNIEESITDRDGKVSWISTTKVPIIGPDGKTVGLVGICHDITARRESADKIQQLNRDLQKRAEELENVNRELEAFSYSVSHDLRAPLRHIDGFAQLLVKKCGNALDAKGRHYLDTIAHSAKEMGQLVDDLLIFSRMGRTEMRHTHFSLHELTASVITEVSKQNEGHEVEWRVGTLPAVEGDPAMLRLALVNLLSNAVKYSRTRTRSEIEIAAETDAHDEQVISVRDNGVGFDMQYAGKLFGVFQRLHSATEFEGTGIGLANVRRIIKRHGGRTWAEGEVGQGATFYFSLPKTGRIENGRTEVDSDRGRQSKGLGTDVGSVEREQPC